MRGFFKRKQKEKDEKNLGYSLGGKELGNEQLEFEAAFDDMLKGKKHIRKPKKKDLYKV